MAFSKNIYIYNSDDDVAYDEYWQTIGNYLIGTNQIQTLAELDKLYPKNTMRDRFASLISDQKKTLLKNILSVSRGGYDIIENSNGGICKKCNHESKIILRCRSCNYAAPLHINCRLDYIECDNCVENLFI
jgi:hypothetical protein